MTTSLTLEFPDSLAVLTLVPPAEGKPPTLDYALMDALESALAQIEARADTLVAVVLRSASAKFFCAGANLKVMETIGVDTLPPWIERGHRLMNRLEALPLPTVARVQGYAMGGGLELAMSCDLIFASSDARFAQSEVKLGLVTGWGGCYRLARRVGLARAKELCFTGRLIEAEEAQRLGVIDWQGPSEQLDPHLRTFVTSVGANSRRAVRETKAILASVPHTTIQENAAIEVAATRQCLTHGDTAARLQAFFAARGKK